MPEARGDFKGALVMPRHRPFDLMSETGYPRFIP
jgi:hypothetical protein